MDYQNVFVIAGLYEGRSLAQADYDRLTDLHSQEIIGKYQAAVFEKQPNGKVKVIDTTSTSRATGAKWGMAIGATIGLLFPPALLMSAAEGAALGALTGNLSKGWFSGDIKRLADDLQPGQAGVVAIAEAGPTIEAARVLGSASRSQQEQVTGIDADKLREQLGSEQLMGAAR